MTAWSWRRVESARVGGESYELTLGGTPAGRLEMYGRIPNPSLVLGPLVDALAGPTAVTAVKPETPLGQPDERPLTGKQRSKIHLGLAELGYRDRDRRLVAIGGIVGRTITTSNELTVAEASVVIDRVEAALRKRHRDGGSAA